MSFTYSKGTTLCNLFNTIAPYYDIINSLVSFGRHHYWRKTLIQLSGVFQGASVLDVCCGTAGITLELAKKAGPFGRVVGVDFSEGMLEIARSNQQRSKFGDNIELIAADALNLPFSANTFDCAVCGYGLRNVSDLKRALLEIKRVIKPGARFAALELAHPCLPVIKQFYSLYLSHWIPFVGQLIAGNRLAYQYLNESVRNYPEQSQITKIFKELGFFNPKCYELTFGIATIHTGAKPN